MDTNDFLHISLALCKITLILPFDEIKNSSGTSIRFRSSSCSWQRKARCARSSGITHTTRPRSESCETSGESQRGSSLLPITSMASPLTAYRDASRSYAVHSSKSYYYRPVSINQVIHFMVVVNITS